MLQANHRGIYEYLWSEHKYVALSISIKAFQTTAGKLGKVPQCLTLLRRLFNHAAADKPELMTGILNAYMHIQPLIQRSERETLIKTLLEDFCAGAQLIYEFGLKLEETGLYGCRLFFPGVKAIYKFWDAQDHPGLWLLFGPFQLHLQPEYVVMRISRDCGLCQNEMREYLRALEESLTISDYKSWPVTLRNYLEHNNLVAQPGLKVHLHPRAKLNLFNTKNTCEICDSNEIAAVLALEKIWDNLPAADTIPFVPDFKLFQQCFDEIAAKSLINKNFDAVAGFEFINIAFEQQKRLEQGKPAQL